ncbi:DEAD/DEAH box helicase [Bifidobacterium tsurumiense]|uniref:Helicase n=1 Tax=Bifidobacterium tsurumiense TaxID=356829 RepID=A0A087EKK4_9BIFI|nr:DEAD/DEAH box helicase [Bifidobacterium tsurumiense]KFJ08305.1 helicase [Bifidobacterium tsurumiense]
MTQDWHQQVYGARTGGQAGNVHDGDGANRSRRNMHNRGVFGHVDEYEIDDYEYDDDDYSTSYGRSGTVPESELQYRGGSSFFRSQEVLDSGRMYEMQGHYDKGVVFLDARCSAMFADTDDYEIAAEIDPDQGELISSHCICPAYGRFNKICKHIIALVIRYNEDPSMWMNHAGHSESSAGSGLPDGTMVVHTSQALRNLIRDRRNKRRRDGEAKQVALLKEVNELRGSGALKTSPTERLMPVGSVTFRPHIERVGDGWLVRLRIVVPARGISYVVKNLLDLFEAIHREEYVVYGTRLAFVHRAESFDERARVILDVFEGAAFWQNGVTPWARQYHSRKASGASEVVLSDAEMAELLDAFVDADVTLDYTPAARYFEPPAPVSVVDGDPDVGLSIIPVGSDGVSLQDKEVDEAVGHATNGDEGEISRSQLVSPARSDSNEQSDAVQVQSPRSSETDAQKTENDHNNTNGTKDVHSPEIAGYRIHHEWYVEQFIQGRRHAFVIVRSMPGTGADGNLGVDRLDATRLPSEVARTTRRFRGGQVAVIHRCSKQFLDQKPLLEVLCSDDDQDLMLSAADARSFAKEILPALISTGQQGSGDVRHGSGHGITAHVPRSLNALYAPTCELLFYMDRDRRGVICDVQAHYGDEQFHVFDGISGYEDVARDRDAERLAVEAVLHYFPRPQDSVAIIKESDEEAIYRLLTEGLNVFRGVGQIMATQAFDGLSIRTHTAIMPGLSVKSGLVEISPIADEISPEEVPALLASYRRRRKFHRLRNGAFVDVGSMDVSKLEDLGRDMGFASRQLESGPVQVPEYSAYYLDNQVDDEAKSRGFTALMNDLGMIDTNAYTVPSSLKSVLRPYQQEGFRWLNAVCDRGFGGILADEMGLGKTVQLLSMLLFRKAESRSVGPSIIVCPTSLVYNWAAECHKFAPELKAVVVAGSKAQRRNLVQEIRFGVAERHENPDTAEAEASPGNWQGADDTEIAESGRQADIVITSYDLLRRDVAEYQGIEWFSVVLDEAQYVKNHATQSAKAVRALQGLHRFALTGTPIENRLAELWSIFDFLMPGLLGSYAHFREVFEMPVLSGDESAQRRLQALVGPFILRRTKAEVLHDLPDKIENVITVQLEGAQRRLYAALEQRLRATLNKQKDIEFETGKIQVLAQLTRLRQVCCDPRLYYESANVESQTGKELEKVPKNNIQKAANNSAKLDAIEELVTSCIDSGQKMLIFSQFTSYLDCIGERLRDMGIAYDLITGATPKRKRFELVEEFNQDDTSVFLISLKAGNTGLNLTGASVVIHADPWWNAAAQHQASDRAHRIGQTRDVHVYQIVAKDTIEERIVALQQAKSDLADKFVGAASTSGSSIASLSREDLLELLS